jgi:hypothetical protein
MVGEGLVAGNQYLNASRSLEMQWGKNQAEINNLSAEARSHDADVGLKMQNLQLLRFAWQVRVAMMRDLGFNLPGVDTGALGGTGGQGAGSGAIQPIAPVGGGTGAAGAPVTAGGAQDKPTLQAQPVGAQPPAGGAAADGLSLYDDPQYKEGMKWQTAGAALGDAQMEAKGRTMIEAAEKQWEFRKAGPQKGAETYAEQGQKDMAEMEGSAAEKTPQLQERLQRLNDMETILKSGALQPGAGATITAEVQNAARRIGLDLGDPSAAFEMIKMTYQDSFDIVRGMKGQVRNMELQSAGKQVPSIDLPLATNLFLIDRMRGAVNQELDRFTDFNTWRDKEGAGATTPNRFLQKWDIQHPYQKYVNPEYTVPKSAAPPPRPANLPSKFTKYSPATGKWYTKDGEPWSGE